MVTIIRATSDTVPQAAVSGKDAGYTHPQRIGARERRLTARAINPSAAGLAQESGDRSLFCCTIQNLLDTQISGFTGYKGQNVNSTHYSEAEHSCQAGVTKKH